MSEVPKKTIPHPDEATSQEQHDQVMVHLGEQFGAGHYTAKYGSVKVEDTDNPKEKLVSFVRVENGDADPEPHGLW